jgi:hypothetical protein
VDISPIFFYAFASLAIACSLLVVLKKNPVASAFSLVVVFFAFAGIYAMLDAHLIATLQILAHFRSFSFPSFGQDLGVVVGGPVICDFCLGV